MQCIFSPQQECINNGEHMCVIEGEKRRLLGNGDVLNEDLFESRVNKKMEEKDGRTFRWRPQGGVSTYNEKSDTTICSIALVCTNYPRG